MNKETGGPAFPASYYTDDGEWAKRDGMTLRDYFAAKASEDDVAYYKFLGGYQEIVKVAPDGTKYIVQEANTRTREEAKYAYADEMLKARKQ